MGVPGSLEARGGEHACSFTKRCAFGPTASSSAKSGELGPMEMLAATSSGHGSFCSWMRMTKYMFQGSYIFLANGPRGRRRRPPEPSLVARAEVVTNEGK